jgi:sialidase-1
LPYNNFFTTAGKLNNFYYAVTVKKKATVAFLGGSITFNPGWRDKVCKYLKETYPATDFHFIAAGIPSLGSLPHAFRLQRDILDSGKTDLLFVEAAVNDRGTDSTTQVRSLEGIIRHAKKVDPYTDVILMAFADPQKIEHYNKGKVSPELVNHEMVARHYNIPYINLALEAHDKIKNEELNWADDFKDIHPWYHGQGLYFATIKSLL